MCGPPGYMWKLTPIREVIEDLRLTTVRMRLCHFRLNYDPLDTAPSGTYIQVATSYPISTKLWQCNCGGNTAHKLDWYGHTQQHAEWRNKTLRILIGHILDQVLKASVPRNAAFLSIYTRIDKNVAKYQLPPKTGPKWDDVQRRITIDNDTKKYSRPPGQRSTNRLHLECRSADRHTQYHYRTVLGTNRTFVI